MKKLSETSLLDKTLVLFFVFLGLSLLFYSGIRTGVVPGPFMWLNHWIPWRNPADPNLGNFIVSDQMDQFYPMLSYMKNSLAAGDFPFWNSAMAFGAPFGLLFIVGHWFPLAAIALLFPMPYVWFVLAVMKFIFMGVFTYKLLRLYKINSAVSLYGAVILSFSYYSVVWAGDFLSYSFSAIPFFYYSVTLFYQEGSTRKAKLLLYLSSITLILGAFPSVTFYGVFVGGLYALFLFGPKLFTKDGGQFMFVGLLAALTCIIPLYYTGEYLSLIDLGWRDKYGNVHLPNRDALLLLFPEYFGEYAEMLRAGYGNFNEKTGYFGIFAFFLTASSLLFLVFDSEYRKKRLVWFWTIIQFWSISMVYAYFGVLSVFGKLPIFNTNSGTRLLAIVVISSVIIASYMLDWFSRTEKSRERKLIGLGAATLLFSIFLSFVLMHEVFNLRNPWHVFSQTTLLAASIGTVLVMLVLNTAESRIVCISLLVGFSFFNLRHLGKDYNSYYPPSQFYRKTPSIEFLLENATDSSKLLAMDKNMLPQTPVFFGISSVEARWFVTQEQKDLLRKFDPSYRVNHNTQHFFGNELSLVEGEDVLDFMNVRYVMYESAAVEPDKLPETWQVAGEFNDQVTLVENLDRPYSAEPRPEECTDSKIFDYYYKNDLIRFTTNRCSPGSVTLPVWSYPGWKLSKNDVNRISVDKQRGFLSIKLPEGKSEVDLHFRPKNLGLLLLLTAAALLVSGLTIFYQRRRY